MPDNSFNDERVSLCRAMFARHYTAFIKMTPIDREAFMRRLNTMAISILCEKGINIRQSTIDTVKNT